MKLEFFCPQRLPSIVTPPFAKIEIIPVRRSPFFCVPCGLLPNVFGGILLLASSGAVASDQAWSGANTSSPTNWFTPGNWVGNIVPIIGDGITIDGPAGRPASVLSLPALSGTDNFAGMTIGKTGFGILNMEPGSLISGTTVTIGDAAGSNGTVNMRGARGGSTTYAVVGYTGTGTLSMRDGSGFLSVGSFYVGYNESSNGFVEVVGPGSKLESLRQLAVAASGNGTLQIRDQGVVTAKMSVYVAGSNKTARGSITVSGDGSVLSSERRFVVGNAGSGDLSILAGGKATAPEAYIGATDLVDGDVGGGTGQVHVSGKGSLLAITSGLTVGNTSKGNPGTGALVLGDDAKVDVGGVINVAQTEGAKGRIDIGGGAGEAPSRPGTLNAPGGIKFGTGTDPSLNFNHTDISGNYQFNSNIDGPGSVNVNQGTTDLTGKNTYSGGTNLNGGTLIASSDSLGSGGINNKTTLVLKQIQDGTLENKITGAGSLIKDGIGNLNLSGNNSGFTGDTQVKAGVLRVNGDLSNSAVTVEKDAGLGGTGKVASLHVKAGGVVAPGNPALSQDAGILTVKNDVIFDKGSRLLARIGPDGKNIDHLTVGGNAQLNGGTVSILSPAGQPALKPAALLSLLNKNIPILDVKGRVDGKFDGIDFNGNFINGSFAYSPSDVSLVLSRNGVAFSAFAKTRNQKTVANSIERLSIGNEVFDQIATSTADLSNTFTALSGDVQASAKGSMIDSGRFVRAAVSERIRSMFAGRISSADDSSGGSGGEVFHDPDNNFWVKGYGTWGRQNGDGNASSTSHRIGGTMLGVDTMIGETSRLGISGGFDNSALTSLNSSVSVDSYHVGVYEGTRLGHVTLNSGIDYVYHQLHSNRSVTLSEESQSLIASYHANSIQFFGEADYEIDIGAVTLQPYVAASHTRLKTDNYDEAGGFAALSAQGDSNHVTTTTIGMHESYDRVAQGGTKYAIRTGLGWLRAYGDTAPVSQFSLGSSQFLTIGLPLARDSALIDAGIDVELSKLTHLSFVYTGQFAHQSQSNGIQGELNVKF